MHLPGMNGKGQQLTVFDKDFIQADAVTDNDIVRAENSACKVAAIRSAEDFDQALIALEVTHQLLHKLDVFQKTPGCYSRRDDTPKI
jgi:hypothetical protein